MFEEEVEEGEAISVVEAPDVAVATAADVFLTFGAAVVDDNEDEGGADSEDDKENVVEGSDLKAEDGVVETAVAEEDWVEEDGNEDEEEDVRKLDTPSVAELPLERLLRDLEAEPFSLLERRGCWRLRACRRLISVIGMSMKRGVPIAVWSRACSRYLSACWSVYEHCSCRPGVMRSWTATVTAHSRA